MFTNVDLYNVRAGTYIPSIYIRPWSEVQYKYIEKVIKCTKFPGGQTDINKSTFCLQSVNK